MKRTRFTGVGGDSKSDARRARPAHAGSDRRPAARPFWPRYLGNGAVQRRVPRPTIQRACACGGSCAHCRQEQEQPRRVQPKLLVGAPGDRFEREADRVADGIATAPATTAGAADHHVRRLPQDGGRGPAAPAALPMGEAHPLSPATRAVMEPHLGADFSGVRVHAGPAAARAAQALRARAFTYGRDIWFGRGASERDSRLVAHELTHVIQQGAGAPPAIQRDDGEEGTTRFEETVSTPPTESGGVHRGQVERTVIAPASATQPEQTIHTSVVNVEFDANGCFVRLPYSFRFVQGSSSAPDICADPPATQAVPALSAARMREIRESYVERLNESLNGWYAVRLDGEGCESACANQDLPIRVETRAVTSGTADRTVTVVNRGGRADASTICARDYDLGTVTHEGGHQVLGTGDEYAERSASVLAAVPTWGRRERVRRTDWSYMGSHHSYGRFSLFHERHFAHVPAFLRAVFPGCRVRLVELSRPVIPDFRIGASGGYSYFGGASGLYLDLGLEMGIPFSRMREWELVLGAHGRVIAQLEDDLRSAFLIGVRAGLQHTWTPSAGGLRLGAFGEAGYGWFQAPGFGAEYEGMPYGEAGLSLGYRFGGGGAGYLGAEVAGGTMFGTVGGETAAVPRTEETLRWFRAGLQAAWEF